MSQDERSSPAATRFILRRMLFWHWWLTSKGTRILAKETMVGGGQAPYRAKFFVGDAAEGLVVERKGRRVLQLSDHTFEPVDPNARHLWCMTVSGSNLMPLEEFHPPAKMYPTLYRWLKHAPTPLNSSSYITSFESIELLLIHLASSENMNTCCRFLAWSTTTHLDVIMNRRAADVQNKKLLYDMNTER
jgi:hypothetical protein